MHNRSCVYGGLSFHISGKSISYHCAHPAVLFSCLYIFQQRLSAYQIVHGLFLQSSQQNINARDLCPKFFAQLACHLGIIHPKATLRHNILEQLFQVIRIRLACTVLAVVMSAADGKAPFHAKPYCSGHTLRRPVCSKMGAQLCTCVFQFSGIMEHSPGLPVFHECV